MDEIKMEQHGDNSVKICKIANDRAVNIHFPAHTLNLL